MKQRNRRMATQSVRKAAVLAAFAGGVMGVASLSAAAPAGEQVVRGNATFDRNGNTTTITASNGSIINYGSFDIGLNETVRFIQPNASSRVLNRVQSSSPTRIDGSLFANGRVYIVNPAGVMFGANSVVNAAQLFAAAGQISNADFVSNVNHFTNVQGGITARGFITADAVHLIGNRVANHGTIVAPQGLVTMLAGEDVLLREQGGRISVRIDGRNVEPGSVSGAHQGGVGTAVENTGEVRADRGRVTLAAGDAVSLAVRNTGLIRSAGGSVHVSASGADADNTGTINVSATTGLSTAGSVTIEGSIATNKGSIDATGFGGRIAMRGFEGVFTSPGSQIVAGGSGGRIALESGGGVSLRGELHGSADSRVELKASDAQIGSSSGRLNEFLDPATVEGFAGDFSVETLQNIFVLETIEKTNGGLSLTAGLDIFFEADLAVTGDLIADAGRDIYFGPDPFGGDFGGQFSAPGVFDGEPLLLITAANIDMTAGQTFIDRVIDFFDPQNSGASLGTSDRTNSIALTALDGQTAFGRATVNSGEVRLTQSQSMGQGDAKLGNALGTDLVLRVTDGDIVLENQLTGAPDELITVRSLDADASGDVIVRTAVNTTGAVDLTSGADLIFEENVSAGTTLSGVAGRDILFGQEFVFPDGVTSELALDGNAISLTASRTFVDRVLDFLDPFAATELGTARTRDIDLVAENGKVTFGTAFVGNDGFVRITQSESRGQGDGNLGNGAQTNLRVTVTDGDLTLQSVAGGGADGVIDVLSLVAESTVGDVIVRESISAGEGVEVLAGRDFIVEKNVSAGDGIVADAGRDILFGADFVPPDSFTASLLVDADTIEMTAGRTFVDRVIDLLDPASGAELGTLRTTDIDLTAQDGRVQFASATVGDGGFVRITQSESRGQSADQLGNGEGTNLRVRVTDGDLFFNGISGGAPQDSLPLQSLIGTTDSGQIFVRAEIVTSGSAAFNAGTDLVFERNVSAGSALTGDAGGDIFFGLASAPFTDAIAIDAATIDLVAGGSIVDRVIDFTDPSVGAVLGSMRTEEINLTATGGTAGFGTATVQDNGFVRVTQRDSRGQGTGDLGNAAQTNLEVTVTEGDLVFERIVGGAADDVIQVLSLLGVAENGDVIVRSAIDAGVDARLIAANEVRIGNDIAAGGNLGIEGASATLAADSVRLAGQSVSIDGPLDSGLESASALVVDGDANFGGDIGANSALASIEVTGQSNLGGASVTTTGGQTWGGVVNLENTTEFTSTETGSIEFNGGVQRAALVDGPIGMVVVVTPDGRIDFRGNIGAPGARLGLVKLSTSGDADTARSDVPRVATIGAMEDVSFFVESFEVLQNEKITVLGDLTIDATGDVTIGDAVATGDLEISADNIVLLRRPGGEVLLADGRVVNDSRVDLAAGDDLVLDGDLVLGGDETGLNPRLGAGGSLILNGDRDFSVQTVALAENAITEDTLILDEPLVGDGEPMEVVLLDFVVQNPPLAIESQLVNQAELPPVPEFTESVTLAVQLQTLERIGIPTRTFAPSEAASASAGLHIASDLPATTDGFGESQPVLAARFDTSVVQALAQRIDRVFGAADSDRTDEVAQRVVALMNAYLEDTGADRLRADAFADWLAAGGEASDESLRTFAELARILDGVESLGLTFPEFRAARGTFAGRVVPADAPYSADEFGVLLDSIDPNAIEARLAAEPADEESGDTGETVAMRR